MKKTLKKLVFASHNPGKIEEIKTLLAPYDVELLTAEDIYLPDVEETGKTFEENAVLKALACARACRLPCLADDSGLCIDALGGRPGVHTARYAKTPDDGMNRLLLELQDVKKEADRGAHFECVLALAWPDGDVVTFSGRAQGRIAFEKLGKGFAYDPIFKPRGFEISFGQMEKGEKNRLSHRGRALAKFARETFGENL